jgi:hypothetical protein
MPYSKDIRCGSGWFEVNVNCFFDYLDDKGEELIVYSNFCGPERKYHNETLENEIEERVNEFIQYKVFGYERNPQDATDVLPSAYSDHIWEYVYYHVARLANHKTDWYSLRSIQ